MEADIAPPDPFNPNIIDGRPCSGRAPDTGTEMSDMDGFRIRARTRR